MTEAVSLREIVSVRDVGELLETRHAEPPPPILLNINIDPLADEGPLLRTWDGFKAAHADRRIPTALNAWRITDCIIVPPHMLLVSSDGRLIAESLRKKSMAIGHPSFVGLYGGGSQEPLEFSTSSESVFLLGAAQSRNYYHWMVESLPRLAWAGLADEHPFILDRKVLPFHNESLRLLNKYSNPLAYLSEPTRFKEVVFVEQPAPTNTRLSAFVAEFYRQNYSWRGARGRKLLVSRSDAGTRRIDNELELLAALEPLGFELLIPSKSSIEDQAQAFAEADVIVGAHGAGLANIAYCKPNALLVEVIPDSFEEGVTSYAAMAELFGLRYTAHIGLAIQPEKGASADIRITPSAVLTSF